MAYRPLRTGCRTPTDLKDRHYRRNGMKQYSEPELDITKFDISDETDFGGDNEVSAGELFPGAQINW